MNTEITTSDRGSKKLHQEVERVIRKFGKVILKEEISLDVNESKDEHPKKEIRLKEYDVTDDEISFHLIDTIIENCLYEHKDSPLVTAKTGTDSRPFTYPMDASTPSVPSTPVVTSTANFSSSSSSRNKQTTPILSPDSRRVSAAFQSPAIYNKDEDQSNVIHQFIKLSSTKTLSVPNAILQACVSSTFFGASYLASSPSSRSYISRSASHSSHLTSRSFSYSHPHSQSTTTPSAAQSYQHNDISSLPLPLLLSNLLTNLHLDLKASLQSHLVFSGSVSRVPGVKARLLQDTRRLVPKKDMYGSTSPLYISGTESLGAWTGASIYLEALSWYFVNEGVNLDSHHHRHQQSTVSVSLKTKLPGEITKEAYLAHGFHKINIPYGLVV